MRNRKIKTKIIVQHGTPLIVPSNFKPSEQKLRDPDTKPKKDK